MVINKMDATTPPYSRDRYCEIVAELRKYLVDTLHFDEKCVVFVPVSGFHGENLCPSKENGRMQVGR